MKRMGTFFGEWGPVWGTKKSLSLERKRVEFIKIALTAQDEAKELKRQLLLNKWRIKREKDTDTPTFCDSGSNVDVINHDTAIWLEDLGFEYQARKPGEESDYIVFGKKGAQSEVIGYVEGEGLVDRLAVVREIEANLISVNTFTQQGMEVIFDQDCVKVMQGDTLRFKGEKDAKTALYRLDIVDLLMTPRSASDENDMDTSTSEGGEDKSERSSGARRDTGHRWRAAYMARAKPRHTAQAINRAMALHRHMKHIPLAIMAHNIECGAWTGLDPMITP